MSASLAFSQLVDSALSGVEGDPDFRDVPCRWDAFVGAHDAFLRALRAELHARCPRAGRDWWEAHGEVRA